MKNYCTSIVLLLTFILTQNVYPQVWFYQNSNTTEHLNGVFMFNELTGWVCGDAGTLLKTPDGGQTWTQVSATGNDLNSIVFKDALTGLAVGDDGVIIRTNDGGSSWIPVNSGTTLQFRKVSWGNGNLVIAAGDDGVAVVSSDDGLNWSLSNTGTIERFRGTAAAGLNKLWAVGETGLIKYSNDGGKSWENQNSGITNDDLHDIQFINESIGFAGGSSSNFIYTSDGGLNWTSRNSGIFMDLNGIFFQNENFGWAVSDFGTIFFTTDGGISWLGQPCGSSNTLNEVYFIHAGKGWTVGDNGTIIMYNNPSVPVELNSFSASVTGTSVNLFWMTATETNNQGFEVQRKSLSTNTDWNKIAFIQGKGTTTDITNYSFEDKNLSAGKYLYRLKQSDFDGSSEFFELQSSVIVETPQTFSLNQNYPNPFNPSTKISFNIPEAGNVKLKIFNVQGREVATLINSELSAGNHEILFNAVDFSSGIYYYSIVFGNSFVETKQMTLIK